MTPSRASAAAADARQAARAMVRRPASSSAWSGHLAGRRCGCWLTAATRSVRERSRPGTTPGTFLDTSALLPVDPPRRVGLCGCSCGIFGCGTLTARIERHGDQVVWRDFYSFTAGEYDGPFHEDSRLPDPVGDPEADDEFLSPTALDLPALTFDAEQYQRVVAEATAGWASAHGRRVDWS